MNNNDAQEVETFQKEKKKKKFKLLTKKEKYAVLNESTPTHLPVPKTQLFYTPSKSPAPKQRKFGMAEKDESERQQRKEDLKDIIKAEHMEEYNMN